MNICGLVLLIGLIIIGVIFEVVNLKGIENVKKSNLNTMTIFQRVNFVSKFLLVQSPET